MIKAGLNFAIPAQTQRGRHHSPSAISIFVIDDSPTIRKVIEIALRWEGYEVTCFRDGIEAMKWLTTPGVRPPDLMLVDIGLPKMDGYEVIRRFRANPRFANTRCLILSGRDGVVDKLNAGQVGVHAYVPKPFTIQELITAVRTNIAGISVSEHVNH
jgi:twitching motility two-component system response regulator PilG